MIKFDKEFQKAKMLKCMIMNCSCEFLATLSTLPRHTPQPVTHGHIISNNPTFSKHDITANRPNEMVSLEDTAISLYTLQTEGGGWVFLGSEIVNWYFWQNVQKFCHATFKKPLHRR